MKETKSKDQDDEEISIDLSKVTSFFKKKGGEEKKSQVHPPAEKHQKTDDEIDIDFSKLKKVFTPDKTNEKKVHKTHQTEHKKENPENDEVEIDFSKIKGIFTKSKKSAAEKNESKDDEEISLNLSKITQSIKNIGKSVKKEGKQSDEEIKIDWKAFSAFFVKHGILLLVLIPILLGVYARMLPDSVPLTDNWAQSGVYNSIRSQIQSQINQQYPNLPAQSKNAEVAKQMDQYVLANKQAIDQQIQLSSNQMKQFFKDDSGKTYMPDIDPYYWYRYAQNVLEKGHPGDDIRDGRTYDTRQLAPIGRYVTPDMFHSYFLAYFHRGLTTLFPSMTLYRTMSYYPVVLSALSILVLFFIGKKISGVAGGFFGALMFAANASFTGRTLFGHADSDAWVILLPLLITYTFLLAWDAKTQLKRILFGSLSAILTGIFSFSWAGWWYIFDFLLGAVAVSGLFYVFMYRKRLLNIPKFLNTPQIKNLIILGVLFFIGTLISVTLFANFNTFMQSFSPFGFSRIKQAVNPTLWPNVLTTVAELNPGSMNQVIGSVGGKFMWYIGILGVILTLFYRNEENKIDIHYAVLLGFWLGATAYASLLGIRFTLLMGPAFSIAFGAALGFSLKHITRIMSKELHIHKTVTTTILVILFLILYIKPVQSSINTGKGDIPIVNDAWFNALTKIKTNSSTDAIITSWWDFGHHFKAISGRRVTFDGTTQDYPPAHWVGRFFSTHDEEEAVGILRMLDCGSWYGFDAVEERMQNVHESLRVLKSIITLSRQEAIEFLEKEGFTQQEISKIIDYTHCSPPEAYVIASNDMVGKSGVWGHFGAWNFMRADVWHNTRDLTTPQAIEYLTGRFNVTDEYARNLHNQVLSILTQNDVERRANEWVAPWPGYIDDAPCRLSQDNQSYVCNKVVQGAVEFEIDVDTFEIIGKAPNGNISPQLFMYLDEEGEVHLERFQNNTIGVGVTLNTRHNPPRIIVTSPELTGGMFTRMFHMGGTNLKYFERIARESGFTGTDVYVYKVNWPEN